MIISTIDTITPVLSNYLSESSIFYYSLTSRSFIIVCCTLLVSLPLSLYRDISSLAGTSFVSVIMIFYIVFVVIIESFTNSPLPDPINYTLINGGIFQVNVGY
jgi:sodium-coupled neutral amino acid transporter 11